MGSCQGIARSATSSLPRWVARGRSLPTLQMEKVGAAFYSSNTSACAWAVGHKVLIRK